MENWKKINTKPSKKYGILEKNETGDEMKKKIIAILLAMLLIFSLGACGDDQEKEPTSDNPTQNEETNDTTDTDDESDTPEYIFPNSTADEEEAEADFGLEIKKSYNMSGTLKKISYKNLSTIGDTLEKNLESALKNAGLGTFVIAFNDYEDDEFDGIDKLAYVAAIEEDDMDKATIEMGVYHSTEDDNYYQYNGYTSETLTKADASVKTILSKIEKAYGIKMSEKKVAAALKTAWETAEKREDYYGLYQITEYKGDGYIDNIIVRVDVGYDEEDNMGAYVYAERERLYT